MFIISNAAVSWKSRKQGCVALSTAEAEYIALAVASQEAVWIKKLFAELDIEEDKPIMIFEDNQSAICIAKHQQHGRTKHVDIKYHYTRDQVAANVIELKHCPSKEMIADALTKPLPTSQFRRLCSMMGLKIQPE